MIKVLDKDLGKKILKIVRSDGTDEGISEWIVTFLKELQDSSGLKICQNVSKDDPAYREVK